VAKRVVHASVKQEDASRAVKDVSLLREKPQVKLSMYTPGQARSGL
jgi:hypothetical protein